MIKNTDGSSFFGHKKIASLSSLDIGTIIITVVPPNLHEQMLTHHPYRFLAIYRLPIPLGITQVLQSVIRSPCMYQVPSTPDFL